jgi:hypothetical protein
MANLPDVRRAAPIKTIVRGQEDVHLSGFGAGKVKGVEFRKSHGLKVTSSGHDFVVQLDNLFDEG